jgi:hypothetical protein
MSLGLTAPMLDKLALQHDAADYEARAESDLVWATKVTDPGLARIHLALAALYLRRALAARSADPSGSYSV